MIFSISLIGTHFLFRGNGFLIPGERISYSGGTDFLFQGNGFLIPGERISYSRETDFLTRETDFLFRGNRDSIEHKELACLPACSAVHCGYC